MVISLKMQEVMDALENGFIGKLEKRCSDWGGYTHAYLEKNHVYKAVKFQTVKALVRKGLVVTVYGGGFKLAKEAS